MGQVQGQVRRIYGLDSLRVHEMLEIPAYDIAAVIQGGNRDMRKVIKALFS